MRSFSTWGTPEIEEQPKSEAELAAIEKQRVWGAIRTDFILSAEIIVISLGAREYAGIVMPKLKETA